MMMETESKKYNKVLNILKKSKPILDSTEEIEREVIKRISKTQKPKLDLSDIIDFIFGWVYIGWVRRSLITASVLLVMVFVWQQGIILRRIEFLSRQTVTIGREKLSKPEDEIEKVLAMYKNSGRKFPYKTINLTEKQMKELLESIDELQNRYKDLENLIEEDPVLKKYIEEKLQENNRSKTKL